MTIRRVLSQINRYRIASLFIHIGVLVFAGFLLRQIAKFRPTEVADRREPVRIFYTTSGSTNSGSAKLPSKLVPRLKSALISPEKPKPSKSGQPSPIDHNGNGVTGHSAWGSGQITIAYLKYFPWPTPDLSNMPKGTEGDVVLSAAIDEQGKITDLTLLNGLNPVVDHDVIQTVRSWTFTPATKDGLPVASKQEIRFHFKSTQNS